MDGGRLGDTPAGGGAGGGALREARPACFGCIGAMISAL